MLCKRRHFCTRSLYHSHCGVTAWCVNKGNELSLARRPLSQIHVCTTKCLEECYIQASATSTRSLLVDSKLSKKIQRSGLVKTPHYSHCATHMTHGTLRNATTGTLTPKPYSRVWTITTIGRSTETTHHTLNAQHHPHNVSRLFHLSSAPQHGHGVLGQNQRRATRSSDLKMAR